MLPPIYPNIIFSLAIFVVFIFVFWNEGKKDGFDRLKLFDVIFVLSILSAMLYISVPQWFIRLNIFNYRSVFLRFDASLFTLFTIYLVWVSGAVSFARRLHWSVYRLLDIFCVAQFYVLILVGAHSLLVFHKLEYLVLWILLCAWYVVVALNRRQKNIPSGVAFALLTVVYAISLALNTNLNGRLLISSFLLTITVLTIYFRRKKSMTVSSFPKDFLDFMKRQLSAKERDLHKQEMQLKSEDPYLQEGRTGDNSDEMDEAILEDQRKEITDAKLGVLKSMHLQVKRALSFLKIGKYGICEICGNTIDKARLQAYPEATKCVNCAARSEK